MDECHICAAVLQRALLARDQAMGAALKGTWAQIYGQALDDIVNLVKLNGPHR